MNIRAKKPRETSLIVAEVAACKKRGILEGEMSLHIVKSLVRLPSVHTVSLVGVVVGWTWSDVRLVHGVL